MWIRYIGYVKIWKILQLILGEKFGGYILFDLTKFVTIVDFSERWIECRSLAKIHKVVWTHF
jgi:hypothetical protein